MTTPNPPAAPAPNPQPTPPSPAQPPAPAAQHPAPASAQQPPASAPAAPVPTPPPTPAPPPVPTPPTWTPPAPAPAPTDDGTDLSKLPQWAQKQITELRQESARYRTSARSETVLRHAYATAGNHGVNGDALLGSVAFKAAAEQLDPNSAEFPAQLATAITTALAANPWMAAQQPVAAPPAPGRGSGDFPGGTGAGQPITEEQLAAMSPDDVAKAMTDGKLGHLL